MQEIRINVLLTLEIPSFEKSTGDVKFRRVSQPDPALP